MQLNVRFSTRCRGSLRLLSSQLQFKHTCRTKQQLILQLDAMFHDYIIQHRKPRALQKLQALVTATSAKIGDLGVPVADLSISQVVEAIFNQVGVATSTSSPTSGGSCSES